MRKYIPSSVWQPEFFHGLPLFHTIQPAAELFVGYPAWPAVEDYNRLEKSLSSCQKSIKFVEQAAKKITEFKDQYEPRIFLKGEVLTRQANWHDFFNMLIWRTFPRCKALLNAKQFQEMLKQRERNLSNRTELQNLLTLFDESGAIIVVSNPELSKLIKAYQWKELFWQQRESVKQQMQFFIFGHAIYEKALQPYIGLTAKSIIFNVCTEFFQQPISEQLTILDSQLAKYFEDLSGIVLPKQLLPLPLLGVPGWCAENQKEEYYENKAYFRDSTKGLSSRT